MNPDKISPETWELVQKLDRVTEWVIDRGILEVVKDE
jgi:hypothetical protein